MRRHVQALDIEWKTMPVLMLTLESTTETSSEISKQLIQLVSFG